jgi:hypothetical protein
MFTLFTQHLPSSLIDADEDLSAVGFTTLALNKPAGLKVVNDGGDAHLAENIAPDAGRDRGGGAVALKQLLKHVNLAGGEALGYHLYCFHFVSCIVVLMSA